MSEGLLDTSVLIDLDDPAVITALPDVALISVISLAELAAGPHLTSDPQERARRQTRLQQIESAFDALEFDTACARSYGQIVAAVAAAGRSHGSRVADLLLASAAHANNVPLYTRNPQDFVGLGNLITLVAV